MGAELGATTSMFPADERMDGYLRATGRGDLVPIIDRNRDMLVPDPEVEAHPEKYYDRVIEIDLSRLEPHVVGPHTPDRARPCPGSLRKSPIRQTASSMRSRPR